MDTMNGNTERTTGFSSSNGERAGFGSNDAGASAAGASSSANAKGKVKILYTIVDRPGGKSWWTRIGAGFVNRDGSINIKLDAIPMSGDLQLRDWEPRENGERPAPARATGPRDLGLGLTSDIPF